MSGRKKESKPQIIEKVLVVDSTGKQLSPKQAIFARVFSDPESPHFMNATKAMQVANPNLSSEVAKVEGSRLLTNVNVANCVVDILNKANLGIEVRAERLKDIISHSKLGTVVSETEHGDNGKVRTVTRHNPSWGQAIKAMDLVNKMDGTYQTATRTVDLAADEYRALHKRFFSPPPRGQEATGQGGKRPRAPAKNHPSGSAEAKNPRGSEDLSHETPPRDTQP